MEAQRIRTFIRHPDTARMLAEAFVPEGSKDLIIIEAASGMHTVFLLGPGKSSYRIGPGQLTRALLNLPKERIKKLIVLETPEKFLDFLRVRSESCPQVSTVA